MDEFKLVADRPKVLIADTIKGRGVSFMEHPVALLDGKGYYRWHSGAPDDNVYVSAHDEIMGHINARLENMGTATLVLEEIEPPVYAGSYHVPNALGEPVSQNRAIQHLRSVSNEYVVESYGKALLAAAARRKDLVVLDADLAADCRIREFEITYPDRFIENGIAEQDMVSMAGGLARQGLLPVVNSFANFLASRANEQIYNNATEGTKIIYVCHYAGLIPAGPGKSHQSIRDISLFGALPNCVIIQPCNAAETRMAVDYCIDQTTENCVLRLVIGPSPRVIELSPRYILTPGQGSIIINGRDAVLFAYGPVMLHEALVAAETLTTRGFSLRVVNMPWLNTADPDWLTTVVANTQMVCVLEDHAPIGGLGDHLLQVMVRRGLLSNKQFYKFGVEGYPACGTPAEALRHHGLDGESLAHRLLRLADRA
jgi:transketolase